MKKQFGRGTGWLSESPYSIGRKDGEKGTPAFFSSLRTRDTNNEEMKREYDEGYAAGKKQRLINLLTR